MYFLCLLKERVFVSSPQKNLVTNLGRLGMDILYILCEFCNGGAVQLISV